VKNMNRLIWLLTFGLLSINTSHAQTMIEVFTDAPLLIQSLPDSPVDVIHYDFSEMERLQATALPKLSSDSAESMRVAKAFFQSAEGEAFKRDMLVAAQAYQKLYHYQLKKVPAVVFDQGKYVVYGTTDIATAREAYVKSAVIKRHQ